MFKIDGKHASYLEVTFHAQLQHTFLATGYKFDFRFHPERKWRFDFAWPEKMLAVEIQGGIWLGGRGAHTSPQGRERDIEKANAAMLMGWRLLQFTAEMVRDGRAIRILDLYWQKISQGKLAFPPPPDTATVDEILNAGKD